jgi:hypothetical protein
MRTHTTLSILTAFLVAAPTFTSAATLLNRPAGVLKLPATSSSSMSSESSSSVTSESSSSVSSSSSSSWSVTPLIDMSSSSTSSSSVKSLPKLNKPAPKPKSIDAYCTLIKNALEKGIATTPDPINAQKFNASIDFLTKAAALCKAMKEESSTSSSSSWNTGLNTVAPSTSSSSSKPVQPNYNECKLLGKDIKFGVPYCKYMCGLNIKTEVCPK